MVVLLLAAALVTNAHAAVVPTPAAGVPWGEATDGADLLPRPTAMSSALTDAPALSAVANDIVGASDMEVVLEDDPVEWASFLGADSEDILGFVIFRPAPSALYHAILLGPLVQPEWTKWIATGSAAGDESAFAEAAMTLVHESFHWRLMSNDESTVNACALKWLPYYLMKDLKVPDTITQVTTESVPVTTTERVPVTKLVVSKRRVKVAGKWIIRTTHKKVTTYVYKATTKYVDRQVTTVVANPLYVTILADAQDFYTHQPPPYNSGTCPVTPPTSPTPPASPTPPTPPVPSSGYHVKACWAQYTGGSWSAVTQSSATTQFSAADILARGAANFWNVVQLDRPPAAAFDGTTVALIEPNGATFLSSKLGQPWPTTSERWESSFEWTWGDKSLFFQHVATSGSGTWTVRWTFPDGEVCNSSFGVGV